MIKEFHNEDCLQAMRKFPDNYFQLAICDPPYGIGFAKTHTGKGWIVRENKEWDKEIPSVEYWKELFRVSKNQIIWGANHYGNMPASPCWIIWDKENGKNDFADCELAYTSFTSAARKFKYRWNGMLQEDMKNKEVRIHPNQKPIQLYKWILTNYAQKYFKILSTHVGSASDLISFEDFGCEYVGYDIDPDHYKNALERLNQHKSQLRLF